MKSAARLFSVKIFRSLFFLFILTLTCLPIFSYIFFQEMWLIVTLISSVSQPFQNFVVFPSHICNIPTLVNVVVCYCNLLQLYCLSNVLLFMHPSFLDRPPFIMSSTKKRKRHFVLGGFFCPGLWLCEF